VSNGEEPVVAGSTALGGLEDRLAEAISTAAGLHEQVTHLAEEFRTTRQLRWAVAALAVFCLLLAGAVGFGVASLNNEHDLLVAERAQGVESGQLLQAIAAATSPAVHASTVMIIDQAVCEIRDNAATVLHQAFPKVAVRVPASSTCPAFTP
jgi:hypothetical protein